MQYCKIYCIISITTIFLYSSNVQAQKADACRDVSIVDLGKGMNRREFHVRYTVSSSCQPMSVHVSCNDNKHVLFDNKFTMFNLTASSSYYCNGRLVRNDVMLNEMAIFEFTTDDGITLTSNSSDAITATLQYDGGRDYESFQIKIDETPHTVQLGVPLTIENLSTCQEYSFASYLLVGLQRVHVGSRTGVTLMETPTLYLRSEGYISAELGVVSECGGLDAVLMCNDLEMMKFKLADDADDNRTFVKLESLMSGHEYACYARIQHQQLEIETIKMSFRTQESLSFSYEGGSVAIRFNSDDDSIYHKFYIQIGDIIETFITPNMDTPFDNIGTCRTYVVKLFGITYDSKVLLEEKTLHTKPDVPLITNAYIGYYKAALEVKLPRDTNCTPIRGYLLCNGGGAPIEYKFNPENSAVVLRNNLNDNSKYICRTQVDFGEYKLESSESYSFQTKESFVLEGRDNDKIVARFIYDDNVYHSFYLTTGIDKYDIFPEIELMLFDRKPCELTSIDLFGVSATHETMLASKSIVIANAIAAPRISTSKPGAYQYTLEIQTPYDLCPITDAKLHCNHSTQPLRFEVIGDATLITLLDVYANMTYKCNATIQIGADYIELTSQEYSFKTEPALFTSTKIAREISVKFEYDGGWKMEKFILYVDGVGSELKLDKETIVSDLVGGQEYKLEVYGQLDFKTPEMFLASQIVLVR